jgi:hypothetical protein
MKSYQLLAFAAISLVACNNKKTVSNAPTSTEAAPKAQATAKDLSWLAGKWQNTSPEAISYENWTVLNDSTLVAVSGFIKGKDTVVLETVSLEERNGELNYIPTVKDQNEGKPVPFKLIEAAGDSFVFSNPGHDFPDKITYIRKSEKSILAKISGKIQGQDHSEFFPMTKVD